MSSIMIPFNDLARSTQRHDEIVDRLSDVIRSGQYINGPNNEAFGRAFAARIGVPWFIGVANGTDALQLAIKAVSIKANRTEASSLPEVITVANAGGFTSTACHQLGFMPVYCDIDPENQLISVSSAVSTLSERTVAVVATHLYGGLVDIRKLRHAMNKAGFEHVAIIEDCAQAHGLDGPDGTAGSLGNVATFSFYPTKNLGAIGDGGAVLTNDKTLSDIVATLHQYGWTGRFEIGRAGGMNSRLDEMQAAILSIRLMDIDRDNKRRGDILDAYADAAADPLRAVRCAQGAIGHLAVLMTGRRDAFRTHLAAKGIASDIHYPVLDTRQPGWRNLPKRIAPGGLAASIDSVYKIVSVPCFPGLTDAEVEHVCKALRSFGEG